jgi:predicted metal-dependent hydrolase
VRDIEVDVTYKDIKNLHIGVYPPHGRVRVAAPLRLNDDQIRRAVIQRLAWIKRQRSQLASTPRQSAREMVTGESHYVWGVRYRMKVVERPGRAHFEIEGDRLVLFDAEGVGVEQRRTLLEKWYREQLRLVLPDVIAKWEAEIGVEVPKWSIRRMKTKWGSCNRATRHIWFNTELAKKPPECLEYIVVHEMMHFFEQRHDAGFVDLMDRHLPDWRSRRDRLNAAPLAAEDWPGEHADA